LAQGVVALDGRAENGPDLASPPLYGEVVAVDELPVFESAQLMTHGAAREAEIGGEMGGPRRTGSRDAVEERVEGRLRAPSRPRSGYGVLGEEGIVAAQAGGRESGESEGILDGGDVGVAERFGESETRAST
jgi:hypothetical protein